MGRRMFSTEIVDSDAFLEMPLTAQALYFHLGARADEDGFVNAPRKIMRACGASDNDLEELINARFVLRCDGGIVVIKHWLIANTLQKDRLKELAYPDIAKKIFVKPNRAYTDRNHGDLESLFDRKQRIMREAAEEKANRDPSHRVFGI